MITFNISQARFVYRVAWACVDDGHVLLHQAEGDDFWALPGGRVEIMESSEAALRREIMEELRVNTGIQIERLLWVVENFFTHQGTPHHELGFYYKVAFQPDSPFYDKSNIIDGIEEFYTSKSLRLIFQWFPLDALEDIPLYPTFLRTGLRSLPASPQHIVHTDPDE